MLPWAVDGTARRRQRQAGEPGAAARSAAADRSRRRRDGPRDPPGHPVLDGCADRRRPDRHLGEGPGQEARRLVGAVVRGRDAGRRRPRLRRLRAAPSPSSSAAPPRCRSRSPARPGAAPTAAPPKAPAKPGLGYVPANVEQPFAQNINAVLISPPQAPVDTLAAAVRRHGARTATQHHRPRAVGRRRGDAMREHGVRQRNPGRRRPPHRGQQRLRTPRIRPASSGRSTSTTPARWAGATSPTTRWSTSTARSSRAARAAWTNRSRVRTPAASTATPGAWR